MKRLQYLVPAAFLALLVWLNHPFTHPQPSRYKAAFAQAQKNYLATKSTTLSSAAEVITVQSNWPTGINPRPATFQFATIGCSTACTFDIERDGTAATATALSIVTLNQETQASSMNAYSASNVGAGTVIGNYAIQAGGDPITVPLSGKNLANGGENLTVRTGSMSGTVTINIQWSEP